MARKMRLSDAQRDAILRGGREWRGALETGVRANAMEALERRGLAEVDVVSSPYRRFVYRLTDAGRALRAGYALDAAAAPVQHKRITVRCPTCGWEFDDGTPGGTCGRCGGSVEEVA